MGVFDNNIVVRWTVRKGLEAERRGKTNFLVGELVYTTDEQRLYAGTGNGSVPLSVKFCDGAAKTRFAGDFYLNGSSLVFRTNDRQGQAEDSGDYITFAKSAEPDGTSIIFKNGRLAVNSIGTQVYKTLDSTVFVEKSNGISIGSSLPIDEVKPSSKVFTVPATLNFKAYTSGGVDTPFTFKGAGSSSATPKTVGLKQVAGGGYEAYVVDMPQGGGGGGGGVNYYFNGENFSTSVDSSGNKTINLKNKLVGVDALKTNAKKAGSSSKYIEVDFTNIDKELSCDFSVGVHENGDGSYSLCKGSGSTPSPSGGGSVVMLDKPIFLCWNGKGKGISDCTLSATLEFNTSPYVYCSRKHMAVKGLLPAFDAGESYESASYVAKLENTTTTPFDYWNNTLCVLGKNNYKNILETQGEAQEDEDGTETRLCFTKMARPVVSRRVFEQDALIDSVEGDGFVEPFEVLRGNIQQVYPLTITRKSTGEYALNESEIRSVSIDGGAVELSELQTDESGICSISSLDSIIEGKFNVSVNGNIALDLHAVLTGSSDEKRTTTIAVEKNAEYYRYSKTSGKYTNLTVEGTLVASSFQAGDVIISRTGNPQFSEVTTTSKTFNLSYTTTGNEWESKQKTKNYEIVGFNKVFTIKNGGLTPLDKVTPKSDVMKRCVHPNECSVFKVPAATPSTETKVAKPMVNSIGNLNTFYMSLIVAKDISKLVEIEGFVLGADGEVWQSDYEPTNSLDQSLELQNFMSLYDAKVGRVAYGRSMENVSFFKKVTKLFAKEKSYASVDKLTIYKNGLEKYEDSFPFAVLGYVKTSESGEPDYTDVTLEPGEGRELSLLKYDFTREDEYKEAGSETMTVSISDLWMDILSSGTTNGISGDGDAQLPLLPPKYQQSDYVFVYSRTLEDALNAENSIERIFLKETDNEPDEYDETGAIRLKVVTSSLNSVPFKASNDGYSVKQYYVGNGLFNTKGSALSEPGIVRDTFTFAGQPSGDLDESVPSAKRVALPSDVKSVLLEVVEGIDKGSSYPKGVLCSKAFSSLREFAPDLGLDESVWADVYAQGSGKDPYSVDGGTTSYNSPDTFVQNSASSTKPALLSPNPSEDVLSISTSRDARIVEVPIVGKKFNLRVSGKCDQSYYGGFSVRLVGYRA